MKLPSLQRECSWVWSEDPALDAPDYTDAPKKSASDSAKKAWAARLTEWRRKLDNARATGQFAPLTKAGQALTMFDLRIIPEEMWREVIDTVQGNQSGVLKCNALIVRLALRKVQNLEGSDGKPFEVELRSDGRWGQIATTEIVDLLAQYHRAIQEQNPDRSVANPIDEMADFIIRRQGGVRPLSERG